MRIGRLSQDVAATLREAPFTCPVELPERAPEGYVPLQWSATLHGTSLAAAAQDLFAWRIHACSGLRVRASDIPLRERTVVILRLGMGPISFSAPCRVLEIIDEPTRKGFVYGTLPGHPESGVERFVVSSTHNRQTALRIDGYSRPHSRAARIAPKLTRAVQARITKKYLRALDRR